MKQSILLLSFCLLACTPPLQAQQKKKPVETPKPAAKPAAPKPKPAPAPAKEPEAYAWLLVTTDMDVNISVNFGKPIRVAMADRGRRIPLDKGDNHVEIMPADGGSDGYTDKFFIDNNGNKFYEIKLKARRDQAAEEQRRAEEARKVEEERKEAEAKFPAIIHDPLIGAMIKVSSGTFTMGCTGEQTGCDSDESPTHQVTLNAFYIGETEVTQAQWRAVMGNNPSYNSGCDQCPVEQVSWDDIQDFLSRLNSRSGGARYRLPTEAEWEYAARGGNETRGYQYAGSNYLDEVAWCSSNSGNKTHPAKGKKANELGLYDMSGNVWEWCQDWKGSYSSGSQTNPTGPSSGSRRVYRGGSWRGDPAYCRVAYRSVNTPDSRNGHLGFRLARTP